MIAEYLAERVRARSLFVSVSGDESRMATDFVLSGTLERLEGSRRRSPRSLRSAYLCAIGRHRAGVVVWRARQRSACRCNSATWRVW